MFIDWYSITIGALQNFWLGFLAFIPKLIGAIIIFIVGWFIAVGVGRLISEVLRRIRFNQLFEKTGWKEALEKAELKVDVSGFVGAISKWVLVIVFLSAAVEVLGLLEFADFLRNVLVYLPNVIVAALIFVVAVIIADILEKVTRAAVEGIKIGYASLAGSIVKWSIWVFAILAILIQLGIARELILTLFSGFVAILVISLGLAFGLGGKEVASEILQDLRKKLKRE